MCRYIAFFLYLLILNIRCFAGEYYSSPVPELAERLAPSVVNISTTKNIRTSDYRNEMFPPGFEELERFFFNFSTPFSEEGVGGNSRGEKLPQKSSLGSGFILTEDGYVITNYHVIAEADQVTVTLNDDKDFVAKIVGVDKKTDIALLKIESKEKLKPVELGDSNEARVGDDIITIGNPFGLGGTVTKGIISARSRNINAGVFDDFIQTDAAINMGNSGGPMFNLRGQVIGINTLIASPSKGSVGIGFAIPINMVKSIVEQLKSHGSITRGWIGVTISILDKDFADTLKLEENKGVVVAEVEENSPAARAGITEGDIILSFNDQEITLKNSLPKMVMQSPIDSEAVLIVIRNNKKQKIKVKIAGLNDQKDSEIEQETTKSNDFNLGFDVANIAAEDRQKHNISSKVKGVIIKNVVRNSHAYRIKLREGDIIVNVNNMQIKDHKHFVEIIEAAKKDKARLIVILIHRDGKNGYVKLPIDIK